MVDPELLKLLRCPVAVKYTDRGDDPGRLEVAHNGAWLVSPESGYKYPVIDDIPVMLVDVGAKFRDVPVEQLPVPPPEDL